MKIIVKWNQDIVQFANMPKYFKYSRDVEQIFTHSSTAADLPEDREIGAQRRYSHCAKSKRVLNCLKTLSRIVKCLSTLFGCNKIQKITESGSFGKKSDGFYKWTHISSFFLHFLPVFNAATRPRRRSKTI